MSDRGRAWLLAAGLALLPTVEAVAAEAVTVDNFVRAETDTTFARYVAQGAFGKFMHIRTMVPLDQQNVIRMNRDTLYSSAVFDLTAPVTIAKPDPGTRFQSMLVIDQGHSMLPVEHAGGRYTPTRDEVGTRCAIFLLRTFADPNDPADMKAANGLQDAIRVEQAAVQTEPDRSPARNGVRLGRQSADRRRLPERGHGAERRFDAVSAEGSRRSRRRLLVDHRVQREGLHGAEPAEGLLREQRHGRARRRRRLHDPFRGRSDAGICFALAGQAPTCCGSCYRGRS